MNQLFKKNFLKFRRNLADYGLRNALIKSFYKIFGFIYKKKIYILYKKNLRENESAKVQLPSPLLKFKQIKSTDGAYINEIENIAEWLYGKLKIMLENGSFCQAMIENDHIIAFNIISFGKVYIPLINLYKKFNADAAWSEHIWVSKKYRNQGLASQLRRKVFEELSARQITWLYGGCLRCNQKSLKLANKLKFHIVLNIIYKKIFGFDVWIYKRVKARS